MLYFNKREEINKIFGGTDGKNETAFRRKPSRFITWSGHLSCSMTCAGLAALLKKRKTRKSQVEIQEIYAGRISALNHATPHLQLKMVAVRRYRSDVTPRPKRPNTPLQRHSKYGEIYSQRPSCRPCKDNLATEVASLL